MRNNLFIDRILPVASKTHPEADQIVNPGLVHFGGSWACQVDPIDLRGQVATDRLQKQLELGRIPMAAGAGMSRRGPSWGSMRTRWLCTLVLAVVASPVCLGVLSLSSPQLHAAHVPLLLGRGRWPSFPCSGGLWAQGSRPAVLQLARPLCSGVQAGQGTTQQILARRTAGYNACIMGTTALNPQLSILVLCRLREELPCFGSVGGLPRKLHLSFEGFGLPVTGFAPAGGCRRCESPPPIRGIALLRTNAFMGGPCCRAAALYGAPSP